MIERKSINRIVAIAVVFALIVSITFVITGKNKVENTGMKTEAEYAKKIFVTDIISIEIIADEADWQEMLDNAINEQFIMADVVVNGTKFQNVGIRPKGNSSLTQVASSDSDRYSFRLSFDEYIEGQTCFGLKSFVVNNMLGDNTYMKEYVSYELMKEIGVDTPYFGYADMKVNGESWGLYLAVELYNESYEQRVFGDTSGMLYNVKSMDMGGGKGDNQSFEQRGDFPALPGGQSNMPNRPEGNFPQSPGAQLSPEIQDNIATQQFSGAQQNPGETQDSQGNLGNQPVPPADGNTEPFNFPAKEDNSMFPSQIDGNMNGMDRIFGGKGGAGSSGGSLEYIDDNTDSYSSIFNNVVGKGTESDYKRVVQALKALSEGRDLEAYFDVDQILRYLAAHTIVVNLDSYSSSMAQNYYIYERDGQLTILPWDYNLAWGGFQSGSAVSVINFPIDTPVSGIEMSSRPLIEKLFSNTEYLERYHSYLQELLDHYFANGKFEEKINTLDAIISEYVKNDATAFCTFDEYKTAVSTFITLGNLRAESVQGQLNGTIPSTTTEQEANADQLISADGLNLSDLGSMMGGKGDFNSIFQDRRKSQDSNSSEDTNREADQPKQLPTMGGGGFSGMPQGGQNSDTWKPSDMSFPANPKVSTNQIITIGVSIIVLVAGLIFAARFKRSY